MRTLMIVFNTLDTDARVQRAATSVSGISEVKLIGIDKNFDLDGINTEVIQIKAKKNIFRYCEFIFKAKKIIRREEFDIFYAHDFYSSLLVSYVRRLDKNCKIIYDAHELFIPQEGQPWSKRSEFFYMAEKKAITNANLIVCANEERARIMKIHYNLDRLPTVVRNISLLPNIEDEYSKKLIKDTEKFFNCPGITLVYAGLIASSRKIDAVFDIAYEHEDCKILIIGNGAEKNTLEKIGREKLGNRVLFTGGVPYKYLSTLLSKCDVGFMRYPVDTLNNINCAPNKIYEYASVELPMISNDNPTVKAIFENAGIGVASDNYRCAYETVTKSLKDYKRNCSAFCEANKWQDESGKLQNAIKGII